MTTCAMDVGAHWGEVMLEFASERPNVDVYAFEPDLHAIWRIATILPNYHALALAVDEVDGFAPLYMNRVPGCSSLHHLDRDGVATWPGGFNFAEVARVIVPTIRLDTFMARMDIDEVSWLKIDTQGHDLAVLRSLGTRIDDVRKITLEVCMRTIASYEHTPARGELVSLLFAHGFALVRREEQTCGAEENWTFEQR